MKDFIGFTVNVVANLCVLALCPLLVLAWIIRVRMHESAWRRRVVARGTAAARSVAVTEPKASWVMRGDSAG